MLSTFTTGNDLMTSGSITLSFLLEHEAKDIRKTNTMRYEYEKDTFLDIETNFMKNAKIQKKKNLMNKKLVDL